MLYLSILFFSLTTIPLLAADLYVSKSGNDGNSGSMGSPKLTIQAAINAASAGDVVIVDVGTYLENVTISKSLTLRSIGSGVKPIIQGTDIASGTVTIQASNVTLGGYNQGFAILGFDGASPGIERAAVYIQGVRDAVTIRGNEIIAVGEAGLLTEFGNAVTNLVVNSNIFSGQTFIGSQAGDCGFSNQFTAANVPRQLVLISSGSGVFFTNNTISGTAGSSSAASGCTALGQGNVLATIDANNATIRGNLFEGTTTRFGASLRARGTGANIFCNTFDVTGLGAGCSHLVLNATSAANLGSPNSLEGIALQNTFFGGGAYHTGALQIYANAGQVTAISQTPIAANTLDIVKATNVTTGEKFCSIQSAINDVFTLNGHEILVASGTHNEDVTINKSITLRGSSTTSTIISGSCVSGNATVYFSAANATLKNVTVTRNFSNLTEWNNCVKNNGILIAGAGTGATVDNVLVTGNRNGIAIEATNTTVKNSIIEANRTGIHMYTNIAGSSILNNFIRNNFTHGVLFNFDNGGSLISDNVRVNNNSITGNWYSQVNFQGNDPAGSMTNLSFSCNWYGALHPAINATSPGEPGYSAQTPSQFGGTAPAAGAELRGTKASLIPYILSLADGTDSDLGTDGFQPTPGSCTVCPGGGLVTNTNTGENFCSIQAAINDADTQNGHTITVAAGTYNEDITLNKSVVIQGASRTTTIINGSCASGNATVYFSVANATLKNVTVTRNFSNLTEWNNCVKNNGILIAGAGTGATVDNVLVTGNRNGIAIEATNTTVKNSIIEANRTGIHMYTNIAGSSILNNFIRNNFTHGVLFNFDNGGSLISDNVRVNNNSITGNWYSQVNFQGNDPAGSMTNLSFSCNWYGALHPAINATSPGEPGYSAQTPSQFGGTAPAAGAELRGTKASLIPYILSLADGTDSDLGTDGFQPTPGSCTVCPGGGLVTNTNTGENFCSIQAAINDADTQNGHTITVAAGTYKEDVSVTKQLTINGAGIDASIVEGPISGGGATFQIAANGVIINGFTITRAGNNTTDWNNGGLNTAGVAVQGQTSKVELKNSKLVGNRNAIDVNNSNGNNIHNNIITNNRTGVIFRNQTDNTLFTENEVTDNWTVGILFLDASSGSNVPVQTALNSTFSQNKITGNWYGGVVDRQTGGSLPAAGSNLKGFNCNWYGSTSPVISTANSSEPMYADLIPVAFGGTASNPGGAPDIAGIASANIQYAPFLSSGTDSDGGTVGFQPVPGSCVSCVGVATIGTATTICEGGNATITVTGTPNTSVTYNINGSGSYTLALNGAGTGTFNTGALSSTTTYNLVSGINGSCTSTLTGSVTITVNLNHSITLSSAVGTDAQASCIGTAIVPITYTLGGAASGVSITGLPAGVTYAVNGGIVSISGVPTASGVFSYNIVTTGSCVTTSTTGTITVNVKPQIKIVANGTEFVEGNNATLCDIDANPSNNTLASTITTNCLSGPVLWRTKIGAAAWSDWTATAPTSQPSDNTEYQYQASCNACPSTITNAIAIKINYRASTPQNVSMVADGTTIQAGQSATLCDQDGNALVFNATCGAGEVLLYSVDGGDYSTTIPSQIVDGNFHNYRVRCRKSDGTPSCIETESAVMTLKLTTISITPTVSITPLNSCTASSTFTGSTTCGSFATLWYDATTNQVLPNLPTTPPTTTTSYYARCQNAEGCLSTPSNTVTYTVLPVNVAPIVTASAESVCTGTSVTLTTNCPAGASVLWNTSATDAVLTVAFNNAITQSYSAQCILGSGCQTPFSEPKSILWKSFEITLINIGQSQSAVKASNDKALWSSQFITKDGGPDLDFSNQGNPTIYFTENLNKTAPRYWTIHADACALGTNGSLTFDMRATPETGVVRSFNTHENNAPYFMYANREGWTELYAPNHPAYGFYQVNEAGGNIYDEGLPKGLYKLSVRYWDMKGWGSIYPATRQPQGNVLAYQEFWFRIVSKDGPGQGAARSAVSGQQLTDGDLSSNSTSFAQVMPNPVTKVMRLGIQGAKGQTVKAELVDVAGRSMLERKFVPETQSHQEEFEVEKLVEGIYFLRVTTPDKQATLKVLKW
ncbi:MAG: right-handed parallel beta-helix repeat-containing protein [Bacteroidetes bacterium]|nr:right-handed parallel beta-helix repeat-containing protein [Bacteroidota bacterium]